MFEVVEGDLFDRAAPPPDAVDRALARLRAAFGEGAAFATRLADRHRPERAFERVPFAATHPAPARGKAKRRARAQPQPQPQPLPGGALRLVDPPTPLATGEEVPRAVAGRRVLAAIGPTRLEGEWWQDAPLRRDYYEVETDDGARWWLYRDRADGRFYLHGVFD